MRLILEKVSKFKKQQTASNSKEQKAVSSDIKYPNIELQFSPQFVYSQLANDDASISSSSPFLKNYQNRHFEDAILTSFLYRKVILVRFTMMSLGLISIFFSIFQKELSSLKKEILFLNTLITLALCVMVILKYFLKEKLFRMQLQRKKLENKYLAFFQAITVQFLVLMVHPNLATEDITVLIEEPIHGSFLPLEINDIFEIIMQVRIYLLFVAFIKSSIYCNTRANRLCRIYSATASLSFGVKSLFEYRPLTFLAILYTSFVVVFAQMITLSQRSIQPAFQNLQNSIWFIIITMGTVGYGQYSPKTYPGRVISFSAAISGIIVSSLLILTLGRYLSMSNSENKSHVTLRRLELRKILENYSKETIAFTTRMIFNKSPSDKKYLYELKKKTEKVKFTIRRIKNMVDTENLKEQINRLFEALSESLSEIYKYQEQYSQLLGDLYEKQKDTIDEIQFSFTTEIQNIIKDR